MSFKTRFAAIAAALALTASFQAAPAKAQVDPFLGQVMLVGFNFCPRGWAKADGQLMAISANSALFSLLGTTYGGDGRTTFALPDMRGRHPVNVGTGPGLANVNWGQKGGADTHTLNQSQLAAHSHGATTNVSADIKLRGTATTADKRSPIGNVPARTESGVHAYHAGPADGDAGSSAIQSNVTATTTVQNTGGSSSFNIRDPYLGMYWCIATVGVYPSRN